jgi:hypothetical protein
MEIGNVATLRLRYVQCSLVRRCHMIDIRHRALPVNEICEEHVRLESVSKEGDFTLKAERIFRPICPRIAEEWLKYATCHSQHMCYVQCKLGWNRSVVKGTLLFRSKHFFARISTHIAVWWLDNTTWHSLGMHFNHCKLGWNRSAMKGSLLFTL